MIRTSQKIPGYDCIRNPCGKRGCGTNPGSSHGIHNEEWYYVVKDGDVALALTVGSGIYPDTVPASATRDYDKPRGYDMTLHVGFPTERGELARASTGTKCDLVAGGACYGDRSGALIADEFTKKHFDQATGFEQPESFWLALEARCAEWGAEARSERVDTKYRRCAHCEGTGTVALAQEETGT